MSNKKNPTTFNYENKLRKLIENLGTLPSVNKSVTNRACVLCTMS